MRNVLLGFVVLMAVGCGGGKGEAAAPEAPAATTQPAAEAPAGEAPAGGEIQGPSQPWDKLSTDEKMQHMKKVVTPHMKQVFQEFDGKKFADFGCTTCHGSGAKRGNFKMPSGEIPKLNPADNWKAHQDKAAELKWMQETVSPQMAKLLGMQPFDPSTNTGFGCGGCHEFVK